MTYARPTRPEQLLDLQQIMKARCDIAFMRYLPGIARWDPATGYYSDPNTIDHLDWVAINFGGVLMHPLIWAEADLCLLTDASCNQLDQSTELDSSFIQFPSALAFFETPIWLSETKRIDVMAWGFSDPTGAQQMTIVGMDLTLDMDLPMCSLTAWQFGTRLDSLEPREGEWEIRDKEDKVLRCVFLALNLLVTQPGIATTEDAPVSRPFRKRAERHNQEPSVRIVRLRHSGHNGHSGNGHHLTKRFIVRGHWRNQTWGPGHSLRRPTWIAPHLKGPEGAPLDTRPTVYVANATPDEVAT